MWYFRDLDALKALYDKIPCDLPQWPHPQHGLGNFVNLLWCVVYGPEERSAMLGRAFRSMGDVTVMPPMVVGTGTVQSQ